MEYIVSPDVLLSMANGAAANLFELLGPGIVLFLVLAGASLLSRLLRMFWR